MAGISLEDRLAIEQLVNEYAWLLDEDHYMRIPRAWRFRSRRLVPIDQS